MNNYTVKELTTMFWKSIILILVLAMIGGGCLGFLAKKKQHTTYTATRNVLITHNLNHVMRISSERTDNNPQGSPVINDQNMMESYKEIAEDYRVTDAARKLIPKKMKNKISSDDFNSAIKAKSEPQSLVLKLQAKSDSAKDSVKMVNATAVALKKQLPKIQPGVGKVVPLAKATDKTVDSKTTPHAKKYAAVGVALGGLVGIVISFTGITLKDLKKRHSN